MIDPLFCFQGRAWKWPTFRPSRVGRRARQCNPDLAQQDRVRASFDKPTAR